MTIIQTNPVVTPPEQRRLMGGAYDLSGAVDAASARALAGLDWEAVHCPLYADLPDNEGLVLAEKDRGVVRNDNYELFGVVGREHKILTNAEMFDFADTLLQTADVSWEAADARGGALAGGKQPFLALQLGEGVQIAGQDAVNCAILLSNGHVGNASFVVTAMPIRLSCGNQVLAALRAGKEGIFYHTVQHSGDLTSKLGQANAALNMTSAYMREFEALANRMAEIEFGREEFDDFLSELIPLSEDAGSRTKVTAEAHRAAFRSNWRNTPTLSEELRGTAWGALNVVTEVIDHGNLDVRKSRVPAAERLVNSVNFGPGARMRNRAYNILAGV